jgi:hypothetical protein
MDMEKGKVFFTEQELQKLGFASAARLRNDRSLGRGLPYVKIGKSVRYRRDHIIKHLKANTIIPGNKN